MLQERYAGVNKQGHLENSSLLSFQQVIQREARVETGDADTKLLKTEDR
jgi:hypothetical protein